MRADVISEKKLITFLGSEIAQGATDESKPSGWAAGLGLVFQRQFIGSYQARNPSNPPATSRALLQDACTDINREIVQG